MRTLSIAATLGVMSASAASAQTVVHYWDFSSMSDVVGGVATTAVGSPDLSLNMTYGEAYTGSGATLNTILGGTSAGGGFLSAAVQSGTTLEMDWGTGSFSFSYWVWDDLASDGDGRGGRIFDCLSGTSTGIQLASNLGNDWNFRVDDDMGAVNIFNNNAVFQLPPDRWVHVVGVVDRGAGQVRAYVDGSLQTMIPFVDDTSGSPIVGNVFPTQDLQIGVINGGTNAGGAQTQGLDDLAFYEGVLTAADAMALANATRTPLDFMGGITRYCTPGVVNSSGMPGSMDVTGSIVAADNNLTLSATSLPTNSFGFFLASQMQGMINQPNGSQGVLCLSGGIGRYVGPGQIQNAGGMGAFSLAVDLTMTPTPTGLVPATAGQTWNFQAWHRDAVGGMTTSNFTDAISVSFQ